MWRAFAIFKKRKTIYTIPHVLSVKRKNASLSFLQETQSKQEIEAKWKNEWGPRLNYHRHMEVQILMELLSWYKKCRLHSPLQTHRPFWMVWAFQYKVLNFILLSNIKLGFITENNCSFCKSESETLNYLLFDSIKMKSFQKDFESYFYSALSKEFVYLTFERCYCTVVIITQCPLLLRNRKHVPCFYRVIQTRVEVWENEKCCGNTSRRRVFPQLSRVLPNFHECLYNSIETRSTCFLFLLENNATRKRKTTC